MLRHVEHVVAARPEALRGSSYSEVCRVLLSLGERHRARRWLQEAGDEGDWPVGAWLGLAVALPEGDPERAEALARAQRLCDLLGKEDHAYIHYDLGRAAGLLDPEWLARQVVRALSSPDMCIRDLMPWMPLAERALGPERMERLVRRLCFPATWTSWSRPPRRSIPRRNPPSRPV
jgi:hypothetical protein